MHSKFLGRKRTYQVDEVLGKVNKVILIQVTLEKVSVGWRIFNALVAGMLRIDGCPIKV